MSDAIPSKSDAAGGNPDVIYIPDPPGLMKTGGLHPTAVTLPLELESRLRARTLGALSLSTFFCLCLALATGREFGGIGPIDFRPNNWYMMALCIGGLGACYSWFASALAVLVNRIVHPGPVLTLHASGLDYYFLNRPILSLNWVDAMSARFVDSVNPDGPGFKDAMCLRCAVPVVSSRPLAPPLRLPFWSRSRPTNETLVPISNLSMHPEKLRYVVEELLRRHGKSVA